MFQPVPIWKIPLVKPRFGCSMDLSKSLQGYDVATQMEANLKLFSNGGKCETGFAALDVGSLRPKPQIEFGFPTDRSMPDVIDYHVSVAYSLSTVGEAMFFYESLESVIRHFPDAFEVVIVFSYLVPTTSQKRMAKQMKSIQRRAPFPIRLLRDENGSLGGWSRLRAAQFCEGDFVLHLDPEEVLWERITYDHIFHFGKPVLPFGRFELENGDSNGEVPSAEDRVTER